SLGGWAMAQSTGTEAGGTEGQMQDDGMCKWISIKERPPSIGQQVWLRCSKKRQLRTKSGPVRKGEYVYLDGFGECFWYEWNNGYGDTEFTIGTGMTHWQPRTSDTPPGFELSPAGPKEVNPLAKRRYNMTPQGTERKRQAMKSYWAKRKGSP